MWTELRNRIYDFAVEKSLEELRDECKEEEYARAWSCDYIWKAGRKHREFTGLTTVCRQIRAEFLFMYNKRTTFAVGLEDLNRYIDVFVKTPGVADEDVVGSLVVSGERVGTTPINLEPLMTLANKARALSIKWYSNTGIDRLDLSPIFDAFLHLDDHPVLGEYVSASVTKIEARNGFLGTLKIRLVVKDVSWEGWMKYTVRRYEEEGCPAREDSYLEEYDMVGYDRPITNSALETLMGLDGLERWAAAVHLSLPKPKALICVSFIPA
jgi:hypothetical protein